MVTLGNLLSIAVTFFQRGFHLGDVGSVELLTEQMCIFNVKDAVMVNHTNNDFVLTHIKLDFNISIIKIIWRLLLYN